MDEQQSSMVFREGSFLSGQQSCMCSAEDMCDMSTVFTLTAAPLPVGSVATDKAIKRIRIVRLMCMSQPCTSKIVDFRALRSNDDFARVLRDGILTMFAHDAGTTSAVGNVHFGSSSTLGGSPRAGPGLSPVRRMGP
jgi:hypothetical protein